MARPELNGWCAVYQGNISRQGPLTGVSRGEFLAAPGEVIALQYVARVRAGSLSIAVRAPDGLAAWRVVLADDGGDRVTLPVGRGGRYAVLVEGRGADGSVSVSWEVR